MFKYYITISELIERWKSSQEPTFSEMDVWRLIGDLDLDVYLSEGSLVTINFSEDIVPSYGRWPEKAHDLENGSLPLDLFLKARSGQITNGEMVEFVSTQLKALSHSQLVQAPNPVKVDIKSANPSPKASSVFERELTNDCAGNPIAPYSTNIFSRFKERKREVGQLFSTIIESMMVPITHPEAGLHFGIDPERFRALTSIGNHYKSEELESSDALLSAWLCSPLPFNHVFLASRAETVNTNPNILMFKMEDIVEAESSVNQSSPELDTPVKLPREISPKLERVLIAARLYWDNASPSDITSQPTNDQIVEYLLKHGFTKFTAERIPSIIRPEWGAKAGRRS